MLDQLQLGELTCEVQRKNIKNVHLSVHPPSGHVTVSAPEHMKLDTIRVYALSKLTWIKKQQKKLRDQARETPREYLERESHFVWGKRYLLTVEEVGTVPEVELLPKSMRLRVRPGASEEKKRNVIEEWYRRQLKEAVPALVAKWEPMMKVTVDSFGVRKMKTKWGSCSPGRGSILLNLELAKKPPECLEYIVAHEMIHLLEPTHNKRFVALMDHFMPQWRSRRNTLNSLPASHQDWAY